MLIVKPGWVKFLEFITQLLLKLPPKLAEGAMAMHLSPRIVLRLGGGGKSQEQQERQPYPV
jgi:hypothetical protein